MLQIIDCFLKIMSYIVLSSNQVAIKTNLVYSHFVGYYVPLCRFYLIIWQILDCISYFLATFVQ